MSTKAEEKKSPVLIDWVLFLVSTVIMFTMIFMGNPYNSWFWLMLPFSTTYFVRALRVI